MPNLLDKAGLENKPNQPAASGPTDEEVRTFQGQVADGLVASGLPRDIAEATAGIGPEDPDAHEAAARLLLSCFQKTKSAQYSIEEMNSHQARTSLEQLEPISRRLEAKIADLVEQLGAARVEYEALCDTTHFLVQLLQPKDRDALAKLWAEQFPVT